MSLSKKMAGAPPSQWTSNMESLSMWWRFMTIWFYQQTQTHYNDVIMGAIASQITSLTIVFSTVYSDADQRKHQSCASLAFVRGIHRGPVNSPHKRPVTRKMFPFDDVIMISTIATIGNLVLLFTSGIFHRPSFGDTHCNLKQEKSKMATYARRAPVKIGSLRS